MWFGIRGADAESLLAIPQFDACFGVTARLEAGKLEESRTLEDLTRHRVDLDAYDIDLDDRRDVHDFRKLVGRALARTSAVSSYRPSTFISDLHLASPAATSLGMFKDRQIAFEHKPWVETQLHEIGLPTIPWRYVPTERRRRIPVDEEHPVVLRPSHTSGGVGISVVRSLEELEAAWSAAPGHLMGWAPFLDDALPLNVNGCVFGTGDVTVHPASVQLIGLPSWTSRRFGYCGNDFAAAALLDPGVLDELQRRTVTIGRWLAAMGYRGAFGADFLVDEDELHFAEINARLQGSSRMAARLAATTGHVDLLLDHVAAFLGLPPGESLTIRDWTRELPPAAQVIKHHLGRVPSAVPPLRVERLDRDQRTVLVPAPDVRVEPGGVSWCLEVGRQITMTGFELVDPDIDRLAVELELPAGDAQVPTRTS